MSYLLNPQPTFKSSNSTPEAAPVKALNMNVLLDGIFNSTDSFDYGDYTDYISEDNDAAAAASVPVLILVVLSVVLILGLFGNTVLLAALALRRRFWRVSDIFILHLAGADLLLLLTLPIRVAQVAGSSGSFGAFCKICGAVFHINFYCGVFGLLCISLDHYLCTNHAAKWRSLRRPRFAAFCCLFVWISSVLLSVPDCMFLASSKNEDQKLRCDYSYSQTATGSMLASRLFHHTVGFSLPVVFLMLLCSYFLSSLLSKDKDLQRRRRRAVIVILSLVLAFLLFWLPYNITLIRDTYLRKISHRHPKKLYPQDSMASALLITSMFGYIHACLRPPIYLLCKKFRDQVKNLSFSNAEMSGSLWELSVEEPCVQRASVEEMKPMAAQQSPVQAH
ncbi:C-X-C chemokine receptor type 1 isoform X1 [Oryzias latipes]|uniref:Chemokine (C-X-C motif) receptor 3, tandem duplicate 3 n=2 Tax=Oryzias latipes TaxID=8090 RepID=A0A3B3HFC0_ORYLA|nr:C-X-C chemokine receptor type 1 isoform X1 [Oryzias latipes]